MTSETDSALGYAGYLQLPAEVRAKLGRQIITPRWWDTSEVSALGSRSWFSNLRRDLNRSGRVTLNLGLLKYEQGGHPADGLQLDTLRFVRDLFEKTVPVTVADLHSKVRLSEEPVFEPSLALLDGQLHPCLSVRRQAELMLIHVADFLGITGALREKPHAHDPDVIQRALSHLKPLLELAGGTERLVQDWISEPTNLVQVSFRGRALIRTELISPRFEGGQLVSFPVLFPPEAMREFPQSAGFGARILGWLEHGEAGKFFLRAIAAATVDILNFETG